MRYTALLFKACSVPPTPVSGRSHSDPHSSVAKRHVKKASQSPRGTYSLRGVCVCVCLCVCVCVCRLPSWLSGTSLQCRRHRIHEFNPWVGKVPWRRARQPTRVFLPGESRGLRSLVGYSPWGCKESDTTEQLSMAKSFT